MIAFATAVLLNLLSWVFERRTARRQLCFLALFICFVAFVYEFLAWRKLAPIFETASGRPNSLLRYIMWGHATPAMLYTLSLISDFDSRRISKVIAVDIFMIATAIPGELIPAWHRWIWNVASCAVFPFVFHEIWCMFSDAISAIHGDSEADRGSRISLSALRLCTVTFWSVFPLVWALVQLGWVSIQTEEILWSCADILGKIVFSSSLLHGNFMTIESRRLAAMRVVEEANRVKVIHELRQLVEQKEGFLALMSHELRTPLNGIIGLSNALLLDLPPEGETTYTIATIRNSGARLLNLINDILDASALHKGRLVVAKNRVILQHAVDDVIELTLPLAHRGVHLTNRIGSDIPPVMGDTSRLVQVLYNLVGNACKFTDCGDIWVDAIEDKEQHMIKVTVHDTGIGIPKDKLVDIFAPFEQVDMSASRRYGGTGLGLNLAKQLIEAQDGTISVTSVPGKGSHFTFTVPIWTGEPTSPVHTPSQQPKRFMLRQIQEEPNLFFGEPKQEFETDTTLVMENQTIRGPLESNGSAIQSSELRTSGTSESHSSDAEQMIRRLSLDSALQSFMAFEKHMGRTAPKQLDNLQAAQILANSAPPEQTFASFRPNVDRASVTGNGAQACEHVECSKEKETEAFGKESLPTDTGKKRVCPSWRAAAAAVESAERSGRINLLSVDDDPVNQMVIETMLRRAGFRVSKAADGQRALDLLHNAIALGKPPDAVLLDVMMPGLNGYDVVRKIRDEYPTLMLPVILVSANGNEDQVVQGLQAGANDYIIKPLRQKELVARIEAHLRNKVFSEAGMECSSTP